MKPVHFLWEILGYILYIYMQKERTHLQEEEKSCKGAIKLD